MRLGSLPLGHGGSPAGAQCEPRQLISDLFHQLSQPLTTLRCSLELTLLETHSPEEYCEIVSRALGQAERASWLVTAMRELFGAGEEGEDPEVIELRRAVEDAVNDLQPVAEVAGVRISYLPKSACAVWFDAMRLRQGLFHLLGSAVAWGGKGAVLNIGLEEGEHEAVLEVAVCDGVTGYRANPEQELLRRLGLGIARAVFEAAGGKFCVESAAEGLRVEVRLPRNDSMFR